MNAIPSMHVFYLVRHFQRLVIYAKSPWCQNFRPKKYITSVLEMDLFTLLISLVLIRIQAFLYANWLFLNNIFLVCLQNFVILFFNVFSHPGYFGKVGMRYFHLTRNKYHCPTINLDKIWSLVSEQTREYYQDKKDGPAPVIDVVRAVSVNGFVLED